MSDTPISDSTPHNVADLGMLCRRLERQLNAANDEIERLRKSNLQLRKGAEEQKQLIKRLEEVGDEMLNWLTDDGISMENLRLIANAWRKAKEAKL